MPKRDPDHAHDIFRLNMWFAITSILLFISFVWMMWQDFGKEWKHFQAEFRRLDIAKTRATAAQEAQSLQSNAEYQKVMQEMKSAEDLAKQQQSELKKAKETQKDYQGTWYKADQTFKFTKAEYEAQRYEYEEAKADHPADAPGEKKKLDEIAANMEKYSAELDQANAKKGALDARVEQFTKRITELEKERSKLATKLDRLIRKEETIGPSIGNVVRNLPLMDFLNPSIKIQQIVVNDQLEELNFTRVPRVDRCMTCHVPIDQEGFEKGAVVPGYKKPIQQPYVSHPDLDLYVASGSKHPVEKFGCTGCHLGRGRATDFVTTVHMPANEEEKKRWEKEYHWHQLHHWDTPMYTAEMVEASCIKCHTGVAQVPQGNKINIARSLFIDYGCHGS